MEPTPDEALLIAYLDGELSPPDRELLDQRLTDESELRHRLTLLEGTWRCLDLLEQESVVAEQIEATLNITAISLSSIPLIPPKIHRYGRWGIAVLAGMVLFVITFTLGKQSATDTSSFRRMVERLEMYRAISDDGLEFLRLLARERAFLPPLPEGIPRGEPHEYEPSFFSGWMSNTVIGRAINYHDESDDPERYQLFSKNYQTYSLLSKEKAEQVRKLHRDIEGAPRSVELALTMQNYYHWLKSLQQYERNDLRNLKTPDEKVADIIELKSRLDRRLSEDTPSMSSEIIGIEESKSLAETLAKLPSWRQERLLNNTPLQIINDLKRSAY